MSENVYYYQSIPQLGIKGRQNTQEEFDKIGLPRKMDGWCVLDIGCNIGAFLLECSIRGADCLNGVEPNVDWRLIANGVAQEFDDFFDIKEDLIRNDYVMHEFNLVLLLSVTHLVYNPQEIVDKAWELTAKDGLLIVEINDRLQVKEVKLPDGAKLYGKNKDNRSVWHCKRS